MPDQEKVDLNMSKVILKCQKYELQYHFPEICECEEWTGLIDAIFSNLFVINIYNSVV